MPTSSVGTARMPAQEASFFMMSFWRIEMSDRLASSALDSSSRTLVRLVRVLDCEVVQAELALHDAQLVLRWLEEAEPDECAVALRPLADLVESHVGDPAATLVRRAVDDH